MSSIAPDVALSGIRKRFGDVVALDSAQLRLRPGTVHALLGENGAGKTTLMRIAYGMLAPDAGVLKIDGHPQRFRSPAAAMKHGIRMVHQHLSLVPAMSAVENFALGGHGMFYPELQAARLARFCNELGSSIDPAVQVATMSAAEQQQLELAKALGGDCRVLILDEPTAVLAPAQSQALLLWLRRFADSGCSAVLITHKLADAVAVADDVTVLRHGRTALAGHVQDFQERDLLTAMLGTVLAAPRRDDIIADSHEEPACVVSLRAVHARGAVRRESIDGVSLDVRQKEIVGVAGLERSGYQLLLRVIAGRHNASSGMVQIPGDVAFIPEDVRFEALAETMDIRENVAIHGAASRRGWIRWDYWSTETRRLIRAFDVRVPNERVLAGTLSGGNQQRLVLARELAGEPALVVAENPTRGLDVRAAQEVRSRLQAARSRGAAIVFYSSDLEELISLADRIVVLYRGHLASVDRSRDAVGRALLGAS